VLAGGAGDDQLAGDAGDDLYRFSADHGNDTIVDATGSNSLEFTDVTAEQLWLTRSGNDLRIGVIGGTTFVTMQGYYAPGNPTLAQSVTVGVRTLDLSLAGSLIQAMTSNSLSTPAAMPESLLPLVEAHWNGDIGFGPVVGNQVLTTDEDTQLSGSVDASDLDNNITGYAQGSAPARGTLNLNTTAGSWTYTPAANAFGADSFTIVVTDAEGNTATQNVAVTINSVNDAPAAINVTGLVASIDERDRPITGSGPPGPIVLATLGVSDPDVGDAGDFASHAYTVDNSNFEVVRVGTEDQLRLRSGVALDYEQGTSVSVNVTARDRNGTGLAVTRGFTFVVNNRDDYFYGGTGNDTITGTAGQNLIYGLGGNDTLTGASANDVLSGGDGDDVLDGRLGNDSLNGDAGADTFLFGPNTGTDTVVDTAGNNAIRFSDVTTSQMWITRSGNDLRIGVIGGTSVVTVQGFYAPSGATLVRSIEAAGLMLHLAGSQALITAMTSASVSTPALMPANVASMLNSHWFPPGAAPPMITDQSFTTAEEAPLSGNVGAFDAENNITGYSVVTGPTRGAVNLNATTGAWTYTPNVNAFGTDGFSIRVTDATGNTAIQNVVMNVTSVNDAPTAINASGLVSGIDERDRPISGSTSPAIVLATLTVSDPDAGDAGDFASHAYSVNDARFEVVGGQLRLRAGVALDYEAETSVSVNVTATDRNGAGLSVTRGFTFAVNNRDDYFYGGAGNDNITGTAGQNQIYGRGGNDTLTGAGANDVLDGEDGNDTLYGLGGIDTLYGQIGDDILEGGAGNDTLRGGDGTDTLRGGDGDDAVYGDSGLDMLYGGIGNDTLEGGAHDDYLEGGDGNDTLRGGTENDMLIGGLGGDRFNGGAGTDTVSYASAAAGVTLSLAAGTGTGGEAAGDVFEDAIERIIGSGNNDNITGSAGDDYIEGGGGNDTILGGAGADTLIGGAGDDTIDAQAGNDILDGGLGSDILIGGDDDDTYRLDASSGIDEIRNFHQNAADIDVVGYAGVPRENLWFERSGNDLIVTAVGTTTRTTIRDWYTPGSVVDHTNYQVRFFQTGQWETSNINAEALVTLMAGYTRPTTVAAFDALRADPGFLAGWQAGWNLNAPPTLGNIGTQTVNEDGSLTISLNVDDIITPNEGLTVTATRVNPSTGNPETTMLGSPSVQRDAAGNYSLVINTLSNISGQGAIRITVTDPGNLSVSQTFLVNVTPVADQPGMSGPTLTAGPVAPATLVSFDAGSLALTLDAWLNDTDGSETLDIRISGATGGLSFNQGTDLTGGVWSFTRSQLVGLRLQAPPTRGDAVALTMTVVAREAANGNTWTRTATLNFDPNARPTGINEDRTLSFSEGYANGTGLAWFTRTDPDNDSASYSIVDSAGGRYSVRSDGLLQAGATPTDYESATSHNIVVRVTDSNGLSFDRAFTVGVQNVNEAPTALNADRTLSFNEGYANGTGLAWFTNSDPENNASTYSIVDSAGGRYSVRSDGLLQAGATLTDFESATSHNIVVRVTDSGGLSFDRAFTVGVQNVNEAPTALNADRTLSFSEGYANGTGLAWFSRTDPDNDGATYSIVDSAGSRYGVRSDGLLMAGSTPTDYESATSHTIVVRVTDSGGLSYDRAFTVNVQNVNEAPTGLNADRTLSFNEGYANGTGLAWFTRTDPDNDGATYSIVDSAGGRYGVRSDGLLMAGSTPTDYESGGTSHTIVVRVTDSGGLSYDRAFTVNVLPVNEAPTAVAATFSPVESNPAPGPMVEGSSQARVTGTDPENDSLRFELENPNGPIFRMTADGYISLVGSLNYEAVSSHTLRFRAWDGGAVGSGLASAWQNITVNVGNVPERPTIGWVQDSNNSTSDWYIGSLTSTDPDGGPVTYEITQAYYHVDQYEYHAGMQQSYTYYEQNCLSYMTVNSAGRVEHLGSFPNSLWGEYWDWQVETISSSGTFFARARDSGGLLSDPIRITFGWYTGWQAPVVFDLDGDGVELIDARYSTTHFAMNEDGGTARNGWVGADDAFLALDRDGDGLISHGAEISFVQDLENAGSDLEGLSAFDTNGNLSLDAGDERFSEFRVWQDRNQDGVSQQDELRSLNDAGIESLSLLRTLADAPASARGNTISATTEFVRTDGTRGQAADVALEYFTLHTEVVDETPEAPELTGIGDVDRGATPPAGSPTDLDRQRPLPPDVNAGEPTSRDPLESQMYREQRANGAGSRARPWRVADMKFDEPRITMDEWSPDPMNRAPSALHMALSSTTRRRLQMIDAMASFEPQGSAELALRPQRHVDSRTLELLTTVPRTASMS
jgi:Ca2+-binding RTX toxin-like protein